MRTNSCSSCCTVLQELVLRVCDFTQQNIKPFQYVTKSKRNNHLKRKDVGNICIYVNYYTLLNQTDLEPVTMSPLLKHVTLQTDWAGSVIV